jgi:hypothetical protein
MKGSIMEQLVELAPLIKEAPLALLVGYNIYRMTKADTKLNLIIEHLIKNNRS